MDGVGVCRHVVCVLGVVVGVAHDVGDVMRELQDALIIGSDEGEGVDCLDVWMFGCLIVRLDDDIRTTTQNREGAPDLYTQEGMRRHHTRPWSST